MSVSDEIVRVFTIEATDIADRLAEGVDALTSLGSAERTKRYEELKRLAHNLKGAASMAGFFDVENLAHAFEDGLQVASEIDSAPLDEFVSDLVETITLVTLMIEGRVDKAQVDDLLHRLLEWSGASWDPKKGDEAPALPPGDASFDNQTAPLDGEIHTLNIDVARLDHLMSFAGGILSFQERLKSQVATSKEILKICQRMSAERTADEDSIEKLNQLVSSNAQRVRRDELTFSHLSGDLTQAMKQVRMVPLSGLARSWRRIVREAALSSGKKVKVDIQVGLIEIDKNVLDHLAGPLLHLLRNAADHGIESPQERISLGKNPEGAVRVTARLEGTFVRLSVQDDGRGLDLEAIGEKALKAGLVNKEQLGAMSDSEKANLIFYSGLSTALQVSLLSGRGVGLDVVRSELNQLGGRVHVVSNDPEPGSKFTTWIPLSILSSRGLFVAAGSTTYVLPIDRVEHTFRSSRDNLEEQGDMMVLPLMRQEPLRVVWLAELMGEQSYSPPSRFRVIKVTRGDSALGIAVDEVKGEQEHITKPLPWNVGRANGVSGGVTMANGTVAIVLDVPSMFTMLEGHRSLSLGSPINPASHGATQKILVADDSMSARTLAQNMLLSAGYQVTVAFDGHHAFELLKQTEFDMVVTDVQMPNMDGIELTQRIRQEPQFKDLPVILVTSLSSKEDIARGAKAGADEYVVKGTFDQAALLEIVVKYL